jgi:hypothetical protein
VRPILSENCFHCHGPDEKARKAKLRLDLAGNVTEELVSRVTSHDPDEIMPPPDSKRSLTEAQINTLRQWVAEGAVYAEHWAFIPPVRSSPGIPAPAAHSPKADRATLLRRVFLDLIGLPPSLEEIAAFENDAAPDAWEKVIDRLLASPRFGEKWARSWLDLARYADSNGFQADQLRDSWAYRDWVIDALNANMPFDQFTIEQIAGDLLPDAGIAQKIATGFHRTVTCNVEAGVHAEENRVNQVVDRVNTTSTVWLGLTLECAQCHDHKYDPLSTRDYYSMFAFFNNTPLEVELPTQVTDVSHDFIGPYLDLPLDEEKEQRRAELKKQIAKSKRKATKIEANWTPLPVETFTSTGGEDFLVLDDGSVLISGKVPDTTIYTLSLSNPLKKITALRLEALTHPDIPGKGPGRGDKVRSNFVLQNFSASTEIDEIKFHSAQANFSQSGWDAAGAIDDDPQKSGWAISPQFGKDHWAVFQTKEPITAASFTVTLDQHFGKGRALGRFRISATQEDIDSPPDIRALEAELATLTPTKTLVMMDMDKPRQTHILDRGNYLSPTDPVTAGTPAKLPHLPEGAEANRLTLARWLVDRRNPLTARVTVNRWWAEIFGTGIVATLEDFGTQSDAPTHPELLDWLAVEFMESGWDMKHILKTIVLTDIYQQSSKVTPDLLASDPENRQLTRGPRFRLSAETIRDNALTVAGLRSDKMHGPPIMPYQPDGIWRAVGRNAPKWKAAENEDRYRRGIYVVWRRAAPYPSFVNFDAPDRASCTVSRPRTNTPLQALTLLNDPAYVELALALADRILTENPPDPITHAFQLVTSRKPTVEEHQVLQETLTHFKNKNAKTIFKTTYQPKHKNKEDLAAWHQLTNILLNLDEFITKN